MTRTDGSLPPDTIRRVREHLGLTRKEFAERLEMSPSMMQMYESGTTRGANPRSVVVPKTVRLAIAAYLLGIEDLIPVLELVERKPARPRVRKIRVEHAP